VHVWGERILNLPYLILQPFQIPIPGFLSTVGPGLRESASAGATSFPGPGMHNIVKSAVHGGECLKCGLLGSWEWIKSQKCKDSPVELGSASNHQSLGKEPLNTLSLKLESLKEGDNKMAMEILDMMEIQDAEERLQDQELALQLMEEEVLMLEMTEQMHQLELLQLEEQELLQASEQKDLSLEGPLKHDDRFPATPMASSTALPTVERQPLVCT